MFLTEWHLRYQKIEEVLGVLKNLQSTIVLTLIVSAGLFLAPKAFAQMRMGQGMHMPKYDPTTVITIKGTVEEVQEGMMQSGQMSQMKGMGHMGINTTF